MANGEWRMANSGWANGGNQQMSEWANGEWKISECESGEER
jgi:hypothetical protein